MCQGTPIGCKTVLVAGDEALLRLDIVALSEERGWRMFKAGNAEGAIALPDQHGEIRVFLTDVHMPGDMDGLKLANCVRDRFSPTLLLAVSRHAPVTREILPVRATFLPQVLRPSPGAAPD